MDTKPLTLDRDMEAFEPQTTREALLALHLAITIERRADAFPDWVCALVDANAFQLEKYAWALPDLFDFGHFPVRCHAEAKSPVSSQNSTSHTTRARASWGLDLKPSELENLYSMAYKSPLFVARRVKKIARRVAMVGKALSDRDKKRLSQIWGELRGYADSFFDDFDKSQQELIDTFWDEIERLRTKPQEPHKCGAKCRSGQLCQMRCYRRPDGTIARRCRLHGGLSTGPRSQLGREAIAASNRARRKLPDSISDRKERCELDNNL